MRVNTRLIIQSEIGERAGMTLKLYRAPVGEVIEIGLYTIVGNNITVHRSDEHVDYVDVVDPVTKERTQPPIPQVVEQTAYAYAELNALEAIALKLSREPGAEGFHLE